MSRQRLLVVGVTVLALLLAAGALVVARTVGDGDGDLPAAVDTAEPPREPPAPRQPRTIEVHGGSYRVTSDLADVIFEVTGGTDDDRAVFVDRGVRLSRCSVNTHGRVAIGIEGGIVDDCTVHEAGHAGFLGNDRYEGTNLCRTCSIGFVLAGTGVTMPPGAVLRAEAPHRFGAITVNLKDSRFEGRIQTDNAPGPTATGFEVYENTQRVFFADIRASDVGGYVAAVARFTDAPVEDIEIASITGIRGDDPGVAITGGVRRVELGRVDLRDVTFGVTIGEDHPGSNRDVSIRELTVTRARWGCIRIERVVGLTIGRAVCTDTGSVDASLAVASVDIGNGLGTGVADVEIRSLEQVSPSGGEYVPRHAIHVDAGARGSIVGICRAWSDSPIANEAGESMRVSCPQGGSPGSRE